MEYTFDANEIQCNGIGGAGYQQALKQSDLIESMILKVRNEVGIDLIWKMILEKDPNGDYHQGSRFNNADRVVDRLATELGRWAWSISMDDSLVASKVKNLLETITKEDAITIVVDAHRDCASADHWYTFEKDWD